MIAAMRFGVAEFPGALVLGLVLLAGCPETKYDVYMKGLEIEGEAERGHCALQYQQDAKAAVLSGDQVVLCLRETERALEYYDKAAQMGHADADFVAVHTRAKERKARLEGMLSIVRDMEREQQKPVPGL
jgi:hypothetical protein